MFKSKQKCKELLKQVDELTNTLRFKEKEIEKLNGRLEEFQKLEDGTPADCKRGTWCQACEFHTTRHIPNGRWGYGTVYFCGKGESCANFVQKED